MNNPQDNTPIGDQLPSDRSIALQPPLTIRLILWQIAKELANVSKELANVNAILKQISHKLK